jgi:hypothetical protein
MTHSARNLFSEWLRFAEAARDFLDGGYWARFQFQTPEAYFDTRLGISLRTVRRWLSVVEGLRRLPAGERPEAERALSGLGSHKAGALAPVLGRDGQDWKAWIMVAREKPEADLQRRVSVALGHRPRGTAAETATQPGETWYARVLAPPLPDELRELTQRVFHLARLALKKPTATPFECWDALCAEFHATYEHLDPR